MTSHDPAGGGGDYADKRHPKDLPASELADAEPDVIAGIPKALFVGGDARADEIIRVWIKWIRCTLRQYPHAKLPLDENLSWEAEVGCSPHKS